jgi:2-polyprenyl-6-methoxyphenol hydroxylase-like FAD-dependent oxidoreductase
MGTWLSGHALVAERFRSGRVFIAGDAESVLSRAMAWCDQSRFTAS